MLLEKLLGLAIKARFLDDQTGILKQHDRRLLAIGKYYENGVLKHEAISIRLVLNKLIYNTTISVGTDARTCVVFPSEPSGPHEPRAAATDQIEAKKLYMPTNQLANRSKDE
ncbi:hypothetical protein [Thiohalomonas denitrificans]|uniref:Uncharacterized protein n=1 Tax=Thiohalomonas denitrificans TaxID=415747 RepID=A0A1G5QMM8_9GAMM|nr:hypothetical protein [Thiohalomonas denitrificans]SCZ62906.1 hypothetical protein SAMN03097708_02381 [Thiohalomonas denitrificans]